MKRAMSFVLALVIMLGVVFSTGVTVSAAAASTASEECIEILKAYEGFCKYPYEDYGQWTVGYGTRCPADKLATYKEKGITEEEAEELLKVYIKNYEEDINYFIKKYKLNTTQNQFDAMFLFSYNCGSGWIYSNSTDFHKSMSNPSKVSADKILFYFGLWSNAGNVPLDGLIKRRMSEANMFLNGVYSTNYPSNFRYVKYNANGGSVEGRVHAFNTDSGAATPLTPSYSGHTFEGWYTSKTGGKLVSKLDASVHGLTLYARWSGEETEEEQKPVEIKLPLTVKVTTDELNVRKGPGTNYASVASVFEGDELTITEAEYDSVGRVWGKYSAGWICMEYTNYEDVLAGKTEEPETPAEPEQPIEPEQPTEPEKPAQPEQPAEPEATDKVMGTITAEGGLFIRSGAGTGYDKVGSYDENERVEILELKVVGASAWGRTDKGWISMTYVKLDATEEQEPEQPAQPETPAEPETPEEPEESKNEVTGTVKVSGTLCIRKGPGISYGIAGFYKNGAKVTITEQQVGGDYTWGKTAKGWISMTYVALDSSADDSESTSGGTASDGNATIQVNTILNIRSGAGSGYRVVGYYKNGTKVQITEQKTVDSVTWGKTAKGWVSMQYVKMDDQTQSNPDNIKTVTASCLNIRANAGTTAKVVGFLYKGDTVAVTETKEVGGMTWGKTAKGWIAMEHTK